MSEESILGWHFTSDKLRDGRPIPPVGEWLVHEGEIEPCVTGLHISEHPFDALGYAPGSVLHRVELAGDLKSHGDPIDKWVGARRRIIASKDCTELLYQFARTQALSVIHMWKAPDVVREYLETGNMKLRHAAWAAARDAKWTAARAAEWAARHAARAAARDAAGAAARNEFLSMVLTEFNMKGGE